MDTRTRFNCNICPCSYTIEKNLKTHEAKVHGIRPEKKFQCSVCKRQFNYQKNLNSHLVKQHEIKPVLKEKTFSCSECRSAFTQLNHLKEHEKKKHKTNVTHHACSICKWSATKKDLLHHYQENHGINIQISDEVFDSEEEFLQWKDSVEKETKTFFSVETKQKHSDREYIYYCCNRSGVFKSKGKDLRELKLQGSRKIGAWCPANIKKKKLSDGSCIVNFQAAHAGHNFEFSHINLTPKEKENIASQLASNQSFDTILDQVRNSINGKIKERIQLLTKKDLQNIEKQFEIGSDNGVYHPNDAVSVDAFVKVAQEEENNPILYYKPQGIQQDGYESDYFLLAQADDDQINFLKQYGGEKVTVDGTHGMAYKGFQNITLMVMDDLNQGLPVGTLTTNHCTRETLTHFFTEIKKKSGPIKTEVFMSEMEDTFYEAWTEVMGKPTHRLYCTWHVDRAWRKNISQKINDSVLQVETYKFCRTLMEETDVETFTKLYKYVIHRFQTYVPKFAEYFESEYGAKTELWALCYRTGLGINSNMHIERYHGILKHIYFKGKNIQRLDKVLHCLRKYIRDRKADYLIAKEKGKLSTKLALIRKRHKRANEILQKRKENVLEVGNMWLVDSSQSEEKFEIRAVEMMQNCNCPLTCRKCHSCIHKFKCNCFDSGILGNMCKHIHLVCLFQTQNNAEENENIDESIQPMCLPPATENECEEQTDENKVAELLENCNSLYSELAQGVTTMEEGALLKKILTGAKIKLTALKIGAARGVPSKRRYTHTPADNSPSNKRIKAQQIYLKGAPKAKKKTRKLTKPSTELKQRITSTLINQAKLLGLDEKAEEYYLVEETGEYHLVEETEGCLVEETNQLSSEG